MKKTRDLMVSEAGKMLGFKRSKFFEFLKDEGFMLRTNGKWYPTDYHIVNNNFKVNHTLVDKENFRAVVPVIRLTEKGFNAICEKVTEQKYANIYWLIVMNLKQAVKRLGLTRHEYETRVITYKSNDNLKGKYILDFGSPEEYVFLEYDYSEGKVWQNSRT